MNVRPFKFVYSLAVPSCLYNSNIVLVFACKYYFLFKFISFVSEVVSLCADLCAFMMICVFFRV